MIKKLSTLLYITILMFFLGDILRKTAIFFDWNFIRYTALSKSIVLALLSITVAIYFNEYFKNKLTRNLIALTFALLIVYLLGQYSLKEPANIFSYNKNILILSRYLFWPITLFTFYPLIKNKDYIGEHFKLFEALFLLNTAIILLGFILNIQIFETYPISKRIGYMGLYNTHNQASYAFMVFILYYYYRLIIHKKGLFKLLFVIAISLLVGTKKLYFFNMLLLIGHIFYFKLYTKKHFYLLILPLVVLGVIFRKSLIRFFEINFSVFIDIASEKGMITSLMSYRDKLLEQTIHNTIIDNWTIPNYIVGGPMFYNSRTELGLVDLYIFFGILGFITFYYIFYVFYLLSGKHKFFLLIIGALIFVAIFAEGFFSSANQPLLILLITSFFALEAGPNNNNKSLNQKY